MPHVVTLYNHKGGVSKTTTTFNMAHFLAEQKYKVLVVDADPQCNITELLLSNIIEKLDIEAEQTGKMNSLPGSSLLDILKPRIEGEVPFVDIDAVEQISVNENLDLIRGDVALNNIEDALAEAHIQRFSNKTHEKRTYVAIADFLSRFGDKNKYDYIFIDVGPSAGALTRSCFLACDAFFIPVSPDRFNVQAIYTLSNIIDRWVLEHNQIYENFSKLSLPVKNGKPRFLGVISQHYKILRGRPKPGYKLWMDRIPKTVVDNLLPVLNKHSNKEINLALNLDDTNITVTQIPDFGSLAPLMQEYGKAVFQIEQDDTKIITESGSAWAGATWKDAVHRIESYRAKFEEIQKRLKWLN